MVYGRAHLGVHINIDGRFTVITQKLVTGDPPAISSELQNWGDEGWSVAWPVHGNGDRGAQLTLQKGNPVANVQAILGVEKDGKRFRVSARFVVGAKEPDGWKSIDSWTDAGWVVTDTTGNLEHGAFWMLVPGDAGDAT